MNKCPICDGPTMMDEGETCAVCIYARDVIRVLARKGDPFCKNIFSTEGGFKKFILQVEEYRNAKKTQQS